MPGGDRTGPMGAGPLTGGGFGSCGSFAGSRGYSRGGRGAGQGGFGRGHGWRKRFWATGLPRWQRNAVWHEPDRTPDRVAERDRRLEELVELDTELDRLRARIEELENRSSE